LVSTAKGPTLDHLVPFGDHILSSQVHVGEGVQESYNRLFVPFSQFQYNKRAWEKRGKNAKIWYNL
jgi:hypothetical protein